MSRKTPNPHKFSFLSNKKIELTDVLSTMAAKGYKIRQRGDYDLNIVGIRRSPLKVDLFNDTLFVFHPLAGQWTYQKYQITTIPGLTYLKEKFFTRKGTAILVPRQYPDAYEIGTHWGYRAVVQKTGKPVWAYRDKKLDGIPQLDPSTIDKGTGGINIHRASPDTCSIRVIDYSAGCQVFRCPEHFDGFMALARRARDLHGNSFHYTLLDEADLIRG